jgi:ribose transport system permease protein
MLIAIILAILVILAIVVVSQQGPRQTAAPVIGPNRPYPPRPAPPPPGLPASETLRGGEAAPGTVVVAGVPIDAKTIAQKYGLIVAWIAVVIVFGAINGAFLNWSNVTSIFGSQAYVVVLTLGLILPLTAGDFDLSVAATMIVSAMTVAILNVWYEWPLIPAMLVSLAAGAVIGAVNAFLILYFRIHSLIVTLGMQTLLHGIAIWISSSQTVTNVSFTLVQGVIVTRIFGMSLIFYYVAILALVLWYFLQYTALGRRLLFVGRGREVARLSGIRVDRVRAGALIGCSMIAALAGVLLVGVTGSAEPVAQRGVVLFAFAGAFMGATAITPGRFNPWGSFIGVYFLAFCVSGMQIVGAPSFVQDFIYGGGLILAVAASQLALKRQPQNF